MQDIEHFRRKRAGRHTALDVDMRGGRRKMMTGVIPFATAILSVALMMSVILLLGLGGSADPQQSYLRLEGHVQWIGGQTIILATNGM